MNEEVLASLDPYGSNINLIRSETASQLQTSNNSINDNPVDRSEEALIEINPELMPSDPERQDGSSATGEQIAEESMVPVQKEEPATANLEGPLEISDSSSE